MARLLYITNGLGGGLNASYELARRLIAAGHTVDFLGHLDLAERVEQQGFTYTRISDADDAMDELRSLIDRVGHVRSIPNAYRLRRQIVASREVETTVEALQPDGLIIDIETHYCVLATRSLGIPTVVKSDWFSLVWELGVPPLHADQALPRTWRERRIADRWWVRAQAGRAALNTIGELHPRKLARRWAPFRYNTVSRRDLRAVARDRGLRLRDLTSQRDQMRPHTYPDIPMISSVVSELDYITKPAPNDHAIGPLVYRDRIDTAMSIDERIRWETFRDRNQATDRPLIYCSFGTFLADTSAMLSNVTAAAQANTGWDFVIGLGGRAEQLGAVNEPNILVLDYAPQLEVLAVADMAISHGGINTINECLEFGVPMLLEQSGETDQPGNASRVAHHGLGVRADLVSIDVAQLTNLIGGVLGDATIRSQVTAMQSDIQRYKDDRVAERTIERLLGIGASQP